MNQFVDELPQNLKIETAIFIHEDTWNSIAFFNGRSDTFIAWICPLLKPQLVPNEAEIFHENQEILCTYFLRQGTCGFVLSPRYNNIKYVDFNRGCVFGVVDILGSLLNFEDNMDLEYCFSNWIVYKDRLKR